MSWRPVSELKTASMPRKPVLKVSAASAPKNPARRRSSSSWRARVLGEPQIIVGAGYDHLAPVHLDGSAVLLGYGLEVGVDPGRHRLVGAGEAEGLLEDVPGARRNLPLFLRGVLHKIVEIRVLRQASPPER